MSTYRSNRGFTLLELVVVLVIAGILATISVRHYSQVFERTRIDEAKQSLSEVRVAWGQYQMDHRDPPAGFASLNLTASGFPETCRAEKFFKYSMNASAAIASRCTSGGKQPQGGTAYNVTLDLQNGTWGGDVGK